MKKFFAKSMIAAALLSAVVFTGMPTAARADSETLGTLGGAAAGGLIGSQFGKGGGNVAATVGGVIAGGIIGNAIGRDADEPRYYNNGGYSSTTYYAPPPPRTVVVERRYVERPRRVVVYDQYRPHYRHYRYYSPYGY